MMHSQKNIKLSYTKLYIYIHFKITLSYRTEHKYIQSTGAASST